MIHLLLVDDDDINNFLLTHLIKKCDTEVSLHICTNAADALQFIQTAQQNQTAIDLMLLDINMPLMSGWDLLDELKEKGFTPTPRPPVYMLSSSVYKADKEIAQNYEEVIGFISKPLSLEYLKQLFAEINEFKQRAVS